MASGTDWSPMSGEGTGRPLRIRLTVLAIVLVATTLLGSAIGLVIAHDRLLARAVNESLVQRADNVSADVTRGAFGGTLVGEGDREDTFAQLIDGTGRVVAASPNAASLPAVTRPLAPRSDDASSTVQVPRLSTHEFRVLARSVDSPRGAQTLVVAKNLDDVAESVRLLIISLAIAIPMVVLILAAVVWWVVGRVLAPVEAIRAEVASMRGTELHRRVPVPFRDDEIARLARTMNALLARVERAAGRQRQFVADASHELRGPLTRIRSVLELGLSHPRSDDPATTYRGLLDDTAQLQQLVDDLLFLAQSESGAVGRPDRVVDLDDLVFEQVRRLRDRGRVRVDASHVSAARVRGDAKQLGRVIANLASNAERHAATTVSFRLAEQDDRSELVVADDGPGIPISQRELVFQRFTRLDEARSRDSGGAGLGLAIVYDIVTRHGGAVSVGESETGGACLVAWLPRQD